MAVAMETVTWRGGENTTTTTTTTKKNHHSHPAWGADAQKLMHMMMGQLHSSREPLELSTLDLFRRHQETQLESSLELEPELPLPSGWEKCLDLQSGKLYYVQKASGVSTFTDPRKQIDVSPHEFLSSKKSEEALRQSENRSSSSSSSLDLVFQVCKRKWEPLDRHPDTVSPCEDDDEEDNNNDDDDEVELDLNLAAGGSSSSPRTNARSQTVCTMEMVQNALRRSENQAASTSPSTVVVKRLTVSSSFSSLTVSTRNDPIDSCSPSTSSSSSTSSRSRRNAPQSSTCTEPVCDSYSGGLVMGACTKCLMYVMLKKMDPRCPRCESEVPVDFSDPPCKRSRVATT